MKKPALHQEMPPLAVKASEHSTSDQTMNQYFKGGPLKNVIEKVEAAQDAVQHSRKKIQKFLARVSPGSHLSSTSPKQCDTLSIQSKPSTTRSAGRIVNQAHSVHKFLTKNTRELINSRKTVHESAYQDPQPTPVHEQYLINIEIIQTLIESIQEEKKSNRIFEKQLKAKKELLSQIKVNR